MQIVVIMGMLVRVIGWAPALAGFLTTCGLIPVTGWLGKKLGAVRRAVVKHTDARVRTTTEVILGIKAIKLYAWEGPWTDRLNELRETELWQILRSSLLQACSTMLFLGVRCPDHIVAYPGSSETIACSGPNTMIACVGDIDHSMLCHRLN